MSTVLAIPDIHNPFGHRDHMDFLREVKRKYRPDQVICLGDEIDAYGLSNYEHDPDAPSAGAEHDQMLEAIQPLYEAFPNVRSCHSNHTARPFRRALTCGIPAAYLKSYKQFMQAPAGWSWHDFVEVDDVRYIHGEGYSGPLGALKAAECYMQSVVIGHVHTGAGILFRANSKFLYWGMNAGCLIDRSSLAFAYGKHQSAKPILGCGLVRDAIPTFLPMTLTRNGRWTGDV